MDWRISQGKPRENLYSCLGACQISKEYTAAFPEKVRQMQRWDEVHEGLLEGFELHPNDVAVSNDPEHYGE